MQKAIEKKLKKIIKSYRADHSECPYPYCGCIDCLANQALAELQQQPDLDEIEKLLDKAKSESKKIHVDYKPEYRGEALDALVNTQTRIKDALALLRAEKPKGCSHCGRTDTELYKGRCNAGCPDEGADCLPEQLEGKEAKLAKELRAMIANDHCNYNVTTPILAKANEACNLIDHLTAERNELKVKIKNQRQRIIYLEGAINHATGTPLSKALQENEKLKAEVERLKAEINRIHERVVEKDKLKNHEIDYH